MYFAFHPHFRAGDHNVARVDDLMEKNLARQNSHELPAVMARMEEEPLYQQFLDKFRELEQPTSRSSSSRGPSRSRSRPRVIGKAAVKAKARPKAKPKAKPKARPTAKAPPEVHSPTPTDPISEVHGPRSADRSYGPTSRSIISMLLSEERIADSTASSSDSPSSSEDRWETDTMEWVQRDCWACPSCCSMNLRFTQWCGCGTQREWQDDWQWEPQEDDWICNVCGNLNFKWRQWCIWSDCPTGDWKCECGNVNFHRRRWCNRSTCQKPRPW